MTAKKIIPILEKWEALYFELRAQCDAIEKIFGNDFDSPLYQAVWSVWRAYTDAISLRLGDVEVEGHTWLSWYWLECDMGRSPKEAKGKGWRRFKNIDNVKRLAELLEE